MPGIAGRVGLIGDPVEHSLSPAFQQPAFDALGTGITYELWPTTTSQIPERLALLRSGAAFGANVTVPHKEAFSEAVDARSEVARRAGAVNTVIARDGRLLGENTDVHGFGVPLQEREFPFATASAVIVGAGGAARGVPVALLDAGIGQVLLVNRTRARAEQIQRELGDRRVVVVGSDELAARAGEAGLLVNATSLGWGAGESPVAAEVFERFPGGAIAYDLTYRETPFLRLAAAAGIATLDGLEMLVHQGARSFELWTDTPAPVALMPASARAARAARAE